MVMLDASILTASASLKKRHVRRRAGSSLFFPLSVSTGIEPQQRRRRQPPEEEYKKTFLPLSTKPLPVFPFARRR
jgi:hypothetical protein